MGKQSSDSAQKGPGVTHLPKSASMGMVTAPVKGTAMPAPKAKDARRGWNTKQA